MQRKHILADLQTEEPTDSNLVFSYINIFTQKNLIKITHLYKQTCDKRKESSDTGRRFIQVSL